jgi:hypothetical protein
MKFKRNSWGTIFLKWLKKGVDPAYAAWMADKYVLRKSKEKIA